MIVKNEALRPLFAEVKALLEPYARAPDGAPRRSRLL